MCQQTNIKTIKIMNTKDLDFMNIVFSLTSSLRADVSILRRIGDAHAADIIDEHLETFYKRLNHFLDCFE